jgi:tetratricopeptide (TPR) repeat protein
LRQAVPESFLLDPGVHVLAGRIAEWAANLTLALEQFVQARQLGAPDPEASLRIARAAMLADREDLAAESLVRLARDHPEMADVWNLLALHELRSGRPAVAVEHFERSLAIDPDQERVRRELERIRQGPGPTE